MIYSTQNHLATRRAFLGRASMGLGGLALSSLLHNGKLSAARPAVTGFPQFEPKVERVIFLCQAGGPSHLELFDHKPALEKRDGKPMPESFTKGAYKEYLTQRVPGLSGSVSAPVARRRSAH